LIVSLASSAKSSSVCALKWKAVHHVWTLARTRFKDACSSKSADLVVREDAPTDKVEGPDRGEDLARTYLYPSEFQELINI
jgi:hypothetical protein